MEKIYTISDLMQAIEDSGRNYDTDRIMAAYKVAEEAHKDQRRRQRTHATDGLLRHRIMCDKI